MPPVKRLPLVLVGGFIVVAALVPIAGGALGGDQASPTPPAAGLDVASAAPPAATDEATPAPAESVDPTPEPPPPTPIVSDVPIVAVAQFRSTRASTDREEVAAVLAGESKRFEALELVAADADAILAALDLARPAAEDEHLILAEDAVSLSADLAEHRKRLAIVRAAEVTPAVRALAWDGTHLFGVDRVAALADWPLTAGLVATAADAAVDPDASWTLFAGGDMLFDRGVYETIEVKGKGVDFPFDGGTAEITSRYCCSSFGWDLPRTRRTGNDGAVRTLISGADLAIANFENPAPDRPRWHTRGTVFSADPDLIDGVRDAGIDYVSIANNHIGDAGRAGILQTIANLEERGLAYSGAGEDEAAARTPAVFEMAGGTSVAILAYDRIARSYFADEDTPGSAPMTTKRVANDIKKARKAGADVVIVFPHWGVEYDYEPFSGQQAQAHDIIDAGADMIIGNHAHYAAAMEVYEGKPIWYALGNFVFDQTWSEPTMEGITLELTFRGAELAQVRMRPHIILDKAQPNFLDPAGDGKVVLSGVYSDLLPW
jgi:hypothetical protein